MDSVKCPFLFPFSRSPLASPPISRTAIRQYLCALAVNVRAISPACQDGAGQRSAPCRGKLLFGKALRPPLMDIFQFCLACRVNSAFDLLLFPELGMIDQSGPLPRSNILCFVFTEFTVLKAKIPMRPPHNSFSYPQPLCRSEPHPLPRHKSERFIAL